MRTGYTLAEAQAVLGALARLHGAFWQSPRLGAAWLPAWNDPGIGALVRGAYAQVWPACRQHFAAALPDDVAAFGDGLEARLPTLVEELAAAPVTLLHGDCRLDNVLFRDEEPDGHVGPTPVFIDWRLVASGRPALDVAYFLTQSGDPAQLAAHEDDLLGGYHAALTDAGADGYGFDDLAADYRRAVAQCFVYPVLAVGSIDPGDAAQVEMAGIALARAGAAVMRVGA